MGITGNTSGIGFINEAHADVFTGTTLNVPVSLTAGNTVCVGAGTRANLGVVSSVVDNAAGGSPTYTQKTASPPSGGYDPVEMWCTAAGASKAATQVTITWSISQEQVASVRQYSNVASFGNVCNGGAGSGTAMSCTLTSTHVNDFSVAAFLSFQGGVTTINQGTNALSGYSLNQSEMLISSANNTVAGSGASLPVSFTTANNSFWASAGVELVSR